MPFSWFGSGFAKSGSSSFRFRFWCIIILVLARVKYECIKMCWLFGHFWTMRITVCGFGGKSSHINSLWIYVGNPFGFLFASLLATLYYPSLFSLLKLRALNLLHMTNVRQNVGTVDTGQYFWKGWSKAYFFKAYPKVKNPKVGSFLRAPEDFEGVRSQKNLIFQNTQIKV